MQWQKKIILFVFLIFLGFSNPSYAEVKCTINKKILCNESGCSPFTGKSYNLINSDKSTYSKCDEKGCDNYNAIYAKSGDFINITLPENSLIAKLSISNGNFFEVATLAMDIFLSYGTCEKN